VAGAPGAAAPEASAAMDAFPPQPVTRQQVTATVTSNAATLVVRRVIPFEDAVFTSTGIGNSQRWPEAAGFPIGAIIVYSLSKTMPSRCQVSA